MQTALHDANAILYVDDEDANRLVFEAAFGGDFPIVCAASGFEALALLEERRFAVLLTDHRMPGMTGVELCERVRQQYPHVVRLLVTAYTDNETVIQAINRGGVDRYIKKPWEMPVMASVLAEAQQSAWRNRQAADLRAIIRESEHQVHRMMVRALVTPAVDRAVTDLGACRRQLDQLAQGAPEPLSRQLQQVALELGRLGRRFVAETELDDGRVVKRPETFRVVELLEALTPLFRSELEGAGGILVRCPVDLHACADRVLVSAVLVNLVHHAAALLRSGLARPGAVEIAASEQDGRVLLAVSDPAPRPEVQLVPRFFEPMVGGLAVSVAHEIAVLAGADLAVAPGRAGDRCTLHLLIPGAADLPARARLAA